MNKISAKLASGKILVSDGAWGTYLMKKGLKTGDCPELWNITHPDEVFDIAMSYINAGSDIIETNSFGGSCFKLQQYSLAEKSFELNKRAAEISRKAAGPDGLVMGSVGPTGKFLIMGDVTEEELYNSFKEQAIGLEKGGVDAVCIETFYDLAEAEQAIKGARENTDLEIIATFTFDRTADYTFKTLMGLTPQKVTESLILLGADIIGANCGVGFEAMITIIKNIREVSDRIPILVQSNAGLPIIDGEKIVYSETPETIKEIVPRLIDAGANIIGGCCGTTPQHIKVISEIVANYNKNK